MQLGNILAVDDDEKIRDLLSTLLRGKGHHVFTADHGQRGSIFFARVTYVTILDFEMPDMDGLAVFSQPEKAKR